MRHHSPFVIEQDAYRDFHPQGYDVCLKHRAKGHAARLWLTIRMLYQAIKAQRWDTQTLESL